MYVTQHAGRSIWYFDDYVPGRTVDCGSFSISEADIIAFAKDYDPQPFHTDPVAAAEGPSRQGYRPVARRGDQSAR